MTGFRIQGIKFKAGPGPGLEPSQIPLTSVCVLIGPNSSGKSRALRDIEALLTSEKPEPMVVDRLDVTRPNSQHEAWEFVSNLEIEIDANKPDERRLLKFGSGLQGSSLVLISKSLTERVFASDGGEEARRHFRTFFINPNVRFTTPSIITSALQAQGLTNFQYHSSSWLMELVRNGTRSVELRAAVFNAFGEHLCVDPRNVNVAGLCLSPTPPERDVEVSFAREDALKFFARAQPIDAAGQGVQAFVALAASVIMANERIMLIDEPRLLA